MQEEASLVCLQDKQTTSRRKFCLQINKSHNRLLMLDLVCSQTLQTAARCMIAVLDSVQTNRGVQTLDVQIPFLSLHSWLFKHKQVLTRLFFLYIISLVINLGPFNMDYMAIYSFHQEHFIKVQSRFLITADEYMNYEKIPFLNQFQISDKLIVVSIKSGEQIFGFSSNLKLNYSLPGLEICYLRVENIDYASVPSRLQSKEDISTIIISPVGRFMRITSCQLLEASNQFDVSKKSVCPSHRGLLGDKIHNGAWWLLALRDSSGVQQKSENITKTPYIVEMKSPRTLLYVEAENIPRVQILALQILIFWRATWQATWMPD